MSNWNSTMIMNALSAMTYDAWFAMRMVMLSVIVACSIAVIVLVLMQTSDQSSLGALSGDSESFLEKNKGKTRESLLKKLTVIFSVVLVVVSIFFFIAALWI